MQVTASERQEEHNDFLGGGIHFAAGGGIGRAVIVPAARQLSHLQEIVALPLF